MRIYTDKAKIIIISESISTFLAKLTGFDGQQSGKKAMGFAVPPCLIVLRNLTHPMTQQWLNHENIHVRQFVESLGIFWVMSILEYLYARLVLKFSHLEAYRYEAVEQEAYLNQHDKNYLTKKPLFNTLKYFRVKTKFYTDSDYHVVLSEEGKE